MFDILSVRMCNFKAFRGNHFIEFPDRPGLYALTGENQANPRMGANGVGKSTLLDAIYWCLYGRTTRGLKANDVVSWGMKQCSVTVLLTVGGKPLMVTRAQNPNSLILNNDTVDQATLEQALRLGPEAFLYAVLLPQYGESFFDLTPGDKLTLLSQILDLDYWVQRSKEAGELATAVMADKRKAEQKLAKQQGQRQTIQHDLIALRTRQGHFEDEKLEACEQLAKDLGTLTLEARKIDAEVNDLQAALGTAEARLVKAGQAMTALRKVGELRALEANLLELGGTCSTCLQPISRTHVHGELQVIKNQVAGLEALAGQAGDVPVLERNRTDFARSLARAQQKQATMLGRGGDLKQRVATERKRANPYSQLIQEKASALDDLQVTLNALEASIAALDEEHASVSFWVGGFKRVRLFIIEETLRQLEVEVNNNLTSLGMLDWRVEFDVERENKSGTVTKGFVVLVHSPDHSEPVRLEAWSGGETQRLKLAGDLGMANLILERAGLVSKIEFHDEPSDHLSDEGLRDLAETLHDRAVAMNKRVWLIDHRLTDHPFTNCFLCIKCHDGARLEALT